MRYMLIALFLIGCGKAPETTGEVASQSYPITEAYGRHTLPQFVTDQCGGVYDGVCELAYVDYFGTKLIEYYGKDFNAVRICSDNMYICVQDWFFEDYVRNYGVVL